MRRLAPFTLLLGCSYDWSLAGSVEDSGKGGVDAAGDGSTSDAADGMFDTAGFEGASSDTASSDTSAHDATSDCGTLLARVRVGRASAKSCTPTAGVCNATVTDECGCESVVADATTKETADYAAAAKAARDAKCTSGCGAACAIAQKGFCLVVDGGTTTCRNPG